jgi:hypothetical protein
VRRFLHLRTSARVALLALLAPLSARADEPHPRTSSLSWVRLPGAESCIATQDLARRVEARLGRSVFVSASQADVSVEGHVEPAQSHARGYRASLTLRDAHGVTLGTRDLSRDDSSCDALGEPLALVIAIMIDPDAALAKPAAAVPAPAPVAPPPEPVVIEKPVYIPVPAPPPRPTWAVDVGASFSVALGVLPSAGLGVAASGLLTPPHFFPLEGFGAAWFDTTGTAASLFDFGGGLCPLHYEGTRFHAAGCALGELGVVTATGRSPFLGVALEARASLRLVGPLALRAGLSAVAPIVDSMRKSVVSGTADLGLGVLFP